MQRHRCSWCKWSGPEARTEWRSENHALCCPTCGTPTVEDKRSWLTRLWDSLKDAWRGFPV